MAPKWNEDADSALAFVGVVGVASTVVSDVPEQEFASAVNGLAHAARNDLTSLQREWVRDALAWFWERGEPIETSFPYDLGDRTVRPAG